MIKPLVFLAIVGVVFLVAMAAAPDGGSQDKASQQRFAADGPPGPVALLGAIFAPFAPTAKPEPTRGACADANARAIPSSSTRYRMLRAHLTPGASAARLVFTPADKREDGESGPYVLCLRGGGPQPPPPADCGDPTKLKPKGSLPVSAGGGCLTVQSAGAAAFD